VFDRPENKQDKQPPIDSVFGEIAKHLWRDSVPSKQIQDFFAKRDDAVRESMVAFSNRFDQEEADLTDAAYADVG
jgi:hypothetical protein